MHQNFHQWLAPLSFNSAEDPRLERRWSAVAELADAASPTFIESLIRLAYHTVQPAMQHDVTRFKEAFDKHDAGFGSQENAREVQLLAAATLDAWMSNATDEAATVALLVDVASFAENRGVDLPLSLGRAAQRSLERLAITNRARPLLEPIISADPPKVDLNAMRAKIELPDIPGAISSLGTTLRNAIRSTSQKNATAFRAFERFLRIQDEELQMLWWTIGGVSNETGLTFDALPAEDKVLLLAKELADLTAVRPGPRLIQSLMERAGIARDSEFTLPELMSNAGRAALQSIAEGTRPSPVLHPITLGATKFLEVGGDGSWVGSWASATGLDPGKKFSGQSIALQTYRERLVVPRE